MPQAEVIQQALEKSSRADGERDVSFVLTVTDGEIVVEVADEADAAFSSTSRRNHSKLLRRRLQSLLDTYGAHLSSDDVPPELETTDAVAYACSAFLYSMGLTVPNLRLLVDLSPQLFYSPLDSVLLPKVYALQKLGLSVQDVVALMLRRPRVFSQSVSALKATVDFLLQHQVDTKAAMVILLSDAFAGLRGETLPQRVQTLATMLSLSVPVTLARLRSSPRLLVVRPTPALRRLMHFHSQVRGHDGWLLMGLLSRHPRLLTPQLLEAIEEQTLLFKQFWPHLDFYEHFFLRMPVTVLRGEAQIEAALKLLCYVGMPLPQALRTLAAHPSLLNSPPLQLATQVVHAATQLGLSLPDMHPFVARFDAEHAPQYAALGLDPERISALAAALPPPPPPLGLTGHPIPEESRSQATARGFRDKRRLLLLKKANAVAVDAYVRQRRMEPPQSDNLLYAFANGAPAPRADDMSILEDPSLAPAPETPLLRPLLALAGFNTSHTPRLRVLADGDRRRPLTAAPLALTGPDHPIYALPPLIASDLAALGLSPADLILQAQAPRPMDAERLLGGMGYRKRVSWGPDEPGAQDPPAEEDCWSDAEDPEHAPAGPAAPLLEAVAWCAPLYNLRSAASTPAFTPSFSPAGQLLDPAHAIMATARGPALIAADLQNRPSRAYLCAYWRGQAALDARVHRSLSRVADAEGLWTASPGPADARTSTNYTVTGIDELRRVPFYEQLAGELILHQFNVEHAHLARFDMRERVLFFFLPAQIDFNDGLHYPAVDATPPPPPSPARMDRPPSAYLRSLFADFPDFGTERPLPAASLLADGSLALGDAPPQGAVRTVHLSDQDSLLGLPVADLPPLAVANASPAAALVTAIKARLCPAYHKHLLLAAIAARALAAPAEAALVEASVPDFLADPHAHALLVTGRVPLPAYAPAASSLALALHSAPELVAARPSHLSRVLVAVASYLAALSQLNLTLAAHGVVALPPSLAESPLAALASAPALAHAYAHAQEERPDATLPPFATLSADHPANADAPRSASTLLALTALSQPSPALAAIAPHLPAAEPPVAAAADTLVVRMLLPPGTALHMPPSPPSAHFRTHTTADGSVELTACVPRELLALAQERTVALLAPETQVDRARAPVDGTMPVRDPAATELRRAAGEAREILNWCHAMLNDAPAGQHGAEDEAEAAQSEDGEERIEALIRQDVLQLVPSVGSDTAPRVALLPKRPIPPKSSLRAKPSSKSFAADPADGLAPMHLVHAADPLPAYVDAVVVDPAQPLTLAAAEHSSVAEPAPAAPLLPHLFSAATAVPAEHVHALTTVMVAEQFTALGRLSRVDLARKAAVNLLAMRARVHRLVEHKLTLETARAATFSHLLFQLTRMYAWRQFSSRAIDLTHRRLRQLQARKHSPLAQYPQTKRVLSAAAPVQWPDTVAIMAHLKRHANREGEGTLSEEVSTAVEAALDADASATPADIVSSSTHEPRAPRPDSADGPRLGPVVPQRPPALTPPSLKPLVKYFPTPADDDAYLHFKKLGAPAPMVFPEATEAERVSVPLGSVVRSSLFKPIRYDGDRVLLDVDALRRVMPSPMPVRTQAHTCIRYSVTRPSHRPSPAAPLGLLRRRIRLPHAGPRRPRRH
jgi:hypothetical protein